MYTRKQALALAKQFRTCPPPFIRNHPDFKAENANHLKICPFCATGFTHGVPHWQALSESFQQQFSAARKHPSVLPGQIRQVRIELGCWRNDLYYNPPLVVVLKEAVDEIAHGVQVAQVWQDMALASPGDLIVSGDLITGFEALFIETWNVYTLRKSDLGACLGGVDSQVVAGALKMKEDPEHLPDLARRALPLTNEDPRQYFQRLEIETGYTFAAMAAAALMGEETRAAFFTASATALVKAIKNCIPTIDWDWVPDTVEECLACLKFPPEYTTLSAADADYEKTDAVYLKLKNGAMDEIKPVECIIHHAEARSDGYTVNGEIPGLPDDLDPDAFQCHIKTTGEKALFPGRFSWDKQGKYFMADFDRPLKSHEKISITIVHDAADGVGQ